MPFAQKNLAVILLLAACVACATDDSATQGEAMPVWPTPPEPTRIRFVRHYHDANDIQAPKGLFGQLAEILAGKKPPIGVYRGNGVHVDAKGRIFLTDASRPTVLMLDPTEHRSEQWGSVGPVQLIKPMGMCSDPQGNLYVGDLKLRRIIKYSPEGEYQKAYGRDGELVRPIGMYFDKKQRRLVVADPGQHKVLIFDAKSGELVKSIGRRGPGEDEFNFPLYVAPATDGGFWVTDAFNFKVKHFDADGKFVMAFGCNATNPGCFSKMKGIATDSEGHLYVTDAAFNNVQIFDQQGRLLMFFGNFGGRNGEFVLPGDIAIDGKDRIYVLDKGNYRVSVFQYVAQKAPTDDSGSKVDKVTEVEGEHDSGDDHQSSEGAAPQPDPQQATEPAEASDADLSSGEPLGADSPPPE